MTQPTVLQYRNLKTDPPAASSAVVQEEDAQLTVTLPPLGLRRFAVTLALRGICSLFFLWTSITSAKMIGVPGSSLYALVPMLLSLVLLIASRRVWTIATRPTVISIYGSKVVIEAPGLIRTRSRTERRSDVEFGARISGFSLRLTATGYLSMWTNHNWLSIHLLHGHDASELKWLANLLNRRL